MMRAVPCDRFAFIQNLRLLADLSLGVGFAYVLVSVRGVMFGMLYSDYSVMMPYDLPGPIQLLLLCIGTSIMDEMECDR